MLNVPAGLDRRRRQADPRGLRQDGATVTFKVTPSASAAVNYVQGLGDPDGRRRQR